MRPGRFFHGGTVAVTSLLACVICCGCGAVTTEVQESNASTEEGPVSQPGIRIVNRSATELSLSFTDAELLEYTLTFTRDAEEDHWQPRTPAPRGFEFGNPDPVYASRARQRSLGISAQQALQTLDGAIAARPMDDVTIMRTHEGVAINLWQDGAITEIWYVGSWLQEVHDHAARLEVAASEANRMLCCRKESRPGGRDVPAPNLDACAAALDGLPEHFNAACRCLAAACAMCSHGDPAGDPACTNEQQQRSELACLTGGPACEVPPPPPPAAAPWVDDLFLTLWEIRDRLEAIIDPAI